VPSIVWGSANRGGLVSVEASTGPLLPAMSGEVSPNGRGVDLLGAAVVVDLIETLERLGDRFGLAWESVEVSVEIDGGGQPDPVTRIDYELRVVTDDDELLGIVAHDLSGRARTLEMLTSSCAVTGHVVPAPGARSS
jgi:hypothetical protein